jgi:hypothetical protein
MRKSGRSAAGRSYDWQRPIAYMALVDHRGPMNARAILFSVAVAILVMGLMFYSGMFMHGD